MAKRTLSTVVEELKQEDIDALMKTADIVYRSRDFDYIDKFNNFVGRLYEEAQDNTLTVRLNHYNQVPKASIKQVKSKAVKLTVPMGYMEAIHFFRQFDKENNKPLISDAGYMFRIKRLVVDRNITVVSKDKRGRMSGFDRDSLTKAIMEYYQE